MNQFDALNAIRAIAESALGINMAPPTTTTANTEVHRVTVKAVRKRKPRSDRGKPRTSKKLTQVATETA